MRVRAVDICGYSPLIRNPVCAHVRRKPHDVGTLYEVSLLETRAQAGDGEMTAAGAPWRASRLLINVDNDFKASSRRLTGAVT